MGKIPKPDPSSGNGVRWAWDRETNRRLVLEFYELFVNQRDYDAAAEYLGDPYVQHRADVKSDPERLRAFNVAMRERSPGCPPRCVLSS